MPPYAFAAAVDVADAAMPDMRYGTIRDVCWLHYAVAARRRYAFAISPLFRCLLLMIRC